MKLVETDNGNRCKFCDTPADNLREDEECCNIIDRSLIIDELRGIYIPQHFATNFNMAMWNVSSEDAAILQAGPEHPEYWETWEEVSDAAYIDMSNTIAKLEQEGDLFAITIKK